MKKFGFGRRLLAMLLVLTMVLGYVPSLTARAAKNDTEPGETNIASGTFDPDTYISWPIKIYDYLNDGMLFEYSSAQDTAMGEATGGAYGGGQPMPTIYGDDNIVNDYTTINGYYKFTPSSSYDIVNGTYTTKNAFIKWGNKSAYAVSYDTSSEGATEVERQIIQPVRDVSPMYMRWKYVGTRNTKAYSWISNFAQDDGVYYSKEDVRYLVIVYKTNETYATPVDYNGDGQISVYDADGNASGDYLGNGHSLRPYWSVTDTAYSDGDTVTGVDISDVSTDHGWQSGSNPTGTLVAAEVRIKPSTDKWAYQIIDMKTNGPMASGQSGYGIAENWDTDVLSGKKVAGIGISIPVAASGEVMDVSHIAYFPTEEYARYFGERAVAFDNDPGEYMGSTITMTHTAEGGTASSSYTAPTVSTGLDLTKTTANGGSWGDSAVTDWWNNQGLDVTDAKYGTTGGYYYARITEPYSGLDTAYVKKGSTNYYVSNYRYITLVYRTNIASPKVGFWIERDGYPAGKGFNGTSYTDKRVSITQSTSEWKSLVYDVAQINNWDTDYNTYFNGSTLDQVGIMFPGFSGSSQYMDIAYVNFSSSSSAANTFATNAKNYLNNFTITGSATSVTTTLSRTANSTEYWNMGSNQAFTMLYASVGGGWAEDSNSGGSNEFSNGYYSYQIGYSYMMKNATSQTNQDREDAVDQGKDYKVSDSIYLLNTYNSTASYLYGVTYETNSNGYAIDETKRFDMSQLDLGYKLYNTLKEGGVMTAGLLQSGIATYTGTDGVSHRIMNYKSDTVHYIATLLRDTLIIPQRDYWGYNYNYVMGTASPLYSEDVDGDGKLDLYKEDLDGDGHLDDRNEDADGDGVLDLSEDIDRDGHLDVYEDLDGDGEIDLDEDLDGDGYLDYWEDIDYDGMIDPGEDRDGDGKLDVGEDLDYDGRLDVDEDLNHNGLLDDGEDVDEDGKLDVDEDVNGNGKLDVWNEDVNHNGVLDDGEDVNGNDHLDRGEDCNCNGQLDAGEDIDGDGRLDMGEDLNKNGVLDAGEDTNGNHKLDVGEDVDYDGHLDNGQEDTNGNGILDEGEDTDGDGYLDNGYEDVNGNGKLDLEDTNGNGRLDLGEDLDGDLHPDFGEDLNGNGELDEGEDINGNGKLDLHEDLDNDGNLDVAEDLNGNKKLDSCDLASALRQCLQITFPDDIEQRVGAYYTGSYVAANEAKGTMGAALGSYEDTMSRINARIAQDGVNPLIGPFLKCRENIKTAFDASYYILHNLFVAGSYNHVEEDYKYLVMSNAKVESENKYAYVFDAGFTNSDGSSATVYNEEDKSIYQTSADGKDQIYYTSSYLTTKNPFLPINDEGEGPESEFRYNGTPYLREDGATDIKRYGDTYAMRNYNYVMAANGEFVYHYGEDLFFDFEGDDDVYMFINDELVLDIGAAHSITKVGFNMNDYVDAARAIFNGMDGYAPSMDDAMAAELFAKYTSSSPWKVSYSSSDSEGRSKYNGSYTATDLLRWHKLNLVDGQDYSIDFYYMERHGWGANMRIATNIVMTDPTIEPAKGAQQGTDIYGEPIDIQSGDLIDDSKPINYNFSITNEGNTKLYRLAFEDNSIGVSLTPTGGLQVYGQPTNAQFNLTSETTLTVSGIDGVMNLDGGIYWLSADGTITTPAGSQVTSITIPYVPVDEELDGTGANKHTMTIYQYGGNTLMEDKIATVVLGTSGGTTTPTADGAGMYTLQDDMTYRLNIDGIRVTDSAGKKLDPADLVFTITGYASEADYAAGKAMDPITVRVADNVQLKQFLSNLQDPKNQTGEGEGVPEGKSALFYGAGLWRHGTVKVSGIHYTLSEEEQEAMVFDNTVYTTAYKSMTSTVPITEKASHKVYCPGDPMYYQWAGHAVHLPLADFWADVETSSKIEGTTLGEKKTTVEAITSAGITNFNVEIVDKNGNQVSVSDNYYNNGTWYTFPGSTLTAEAGKRTIYYKHYHDWSAADTDTVYVYYWSDTNSNMVSWPGKQMSVKRVDGDNKTVYTYDIPADAKYVIFNNGDVNNMTQTADISVPLVDYDKVTWMDTEKVLRVFYDNPGKHMFYVKMVNKTDSTLQITVPVTFYVAKTEDKTYVLDYGLSTEELNAGGLLFKGDEFLATELLGNKTFTATKLMGITTTEPTYLGTWSTDAYNKGNINRISFTSTAATQVAGGTDYYYDLGDGRYYMNTTVAQTGNPINYLNGNYSMSTQLWFTPEKFMDAPYDLWLAISVHEKDAVGPGQTGDKVYHAPTGVSTTTGTSYVDIKSEVQMFKKVTVLPATVVYYEDDFLDITYNDTSSGVFEHHGKGSGTLTQGIEQDVPYGQDATYQHGSNVEMSGESLTKLEISDPNEQASFTFTGTGFELISRTNATDAASFVVEVFKKTAAGEELVHRLPVITEFTSSASSCTHDHHDATGHCSFCNMDVGHSFTDGVCTGCGVTEPTFYLTGNINGSDYDGTDYAFVDGRLTVTFQKDSYVVVKQDDGTQYWTNGYYANATSVVLYNTTMYGDKISSNKMHVPAGVELTFYLIDNGNGAMTLSYSTDVQRFGPRTVYFDNTDYKWENVLIYYWASGFTGPNPWPGVEMTKVAGSDTLYTYVVPSDANMVVFNNGITSGSDSHQTSDLVVPGDGYVFKNGTWSVYGEDSGETDPDLPTTKLVYFRDTAGWGAAHIYYWNTGSDTSWPGLQMSLVEGETDLFVIEVPVATKNLLFHNGSGTQTSDLSIPDDVDPPLYNYSTGWFSYGDDESGDNAEQITLYFNNTGNWSNVYAYYWGGTGGNSWPGNAMTHVSGDVYSITLNADNKNIIFNNNSGTQTSDLSILGDGFRYRSDGGTGGNWIFPDGETKVIYLRNTYGWKNFYAWAWGNVGGTNVNCFDSWPGTPMTVVGTTGYYAVTVPVQAQYIIFSDGSSNQTATLTLDDSKPTYEGNQWTATDPTRIVPREIFFQNESGWENVYAFTWYDAQGDLMAWPGVKMEVSSDDFYSCEIPGNSKYVIFHDGTADSSDGLKTVNVSETKNAYTSTGWGDYVDVDTDEIYQVPVLKLNDLDYGTYRVSICGMTQYDDSIDWNHAGSLMSEVEAAEDAKNELALIVADYGSLEARVEELREQGETEEADRVANLPNVIARGPEADAELTAYLASHIMPVTLYIDGVRIYQPIASNGVNGSHDKYAVNENGAAFKELRDLILDGQAAVAVYNEDSTTTYTGNLSWTENRNGVLYDWDTEDQSATTTKYTGNQLSGIDDYLLVGPNNECYVNGNLREEAVVFYVTEDTTVKDHTLQIGVRGLDQGLFLYGKSSGISAALYQGVMISYPDGTSAQGWSPVAAVSSSTEQYYQIDYKSCPSFLKEIDGEEVRVYQVVLYVRSGMVSFTNVKYKSLSIVDLGASKTTYKYDSNGVLVSQNSGSAEGGGEVTGENNGVALDFASVSAQMRSDIYTGEIVDLPETPDTDEPVVDELIKPTLDLKYASLSFEDEIHYNFYFNASNLDDVVEMGLMTFDGDQVSDVIPDYITDGSIYMVSTNSIAAANMGDDVWFKVYAKLSDGSYVYSDMKSYSAVDYANTILGRESSSSYMKSLVVAMLNYGAEAQLYFGHDTDALMNAGLTAEQQALVGAYDESMVADLVAVDSTKAGSFVYDGSSFAKRAPSVSFDGAFAINYYFTAANVPDDGMTLYYWDLETYEAVDALTIENATGSMVMEATDVENQYWGQVAGIAAKQIDETVFVVGVYQHDGVTYTTGVLNYSIGRYCETIAARDTSDQQAFAKATAVYGKYAKAYFDNI